MNSSSPSMICIARDTLAREFADMDTKSTAELQASLDEVTAIQDALHELAASVRTKLQSRMTRELRPSSWIDSFPEDTLSGLGLPLAIVEKLGPQGLGIRSVSRQLTQYSRATLAQQLRDYNARSIVLYPNVEELGEGEVNEILDAVEAALRGTEHSLAA